MAELPELIGAWQIVAVDDRDGPGQPWESYGPEPGGVIVYDASGVVSAHLIREGTIDGYLGYWGRYRVTESTTDDEAITGVVEHHLDGGSESMLFDESPARPFRLSGDTLVIGDGETFRRELRRIGPDD